MLNRDLRVWSNRTQHSILRQSIMHEKWGWIGCVVYHYSFIHVLFSSHIFQHNVLSLVQWVCIKCLKIEEMSRKTNMYTKNAALEGIWTHCVVWCLAAFYGLSLFNFHWIGSAWRFLPPLYSLHSKEVEKSFEFWCPT